MTFPWNFTVPSLLEFFNRVMDRKTIFYMAVNAMFEFCAVGKAVVPLFGAIDFSPKERFQYLQRFNTLINDKSSDKIKALNGEQPKAAVICMQGMNLIYMIDHDYKEEKIHCFETDLFKKNLNREIEDSTLKILDFSPDLWQAYLNEASKNLEV